MTFKAKNTLSSHNFSSPGYFHSEGYYAILLAAVLMFFILCASTRLKVFDLNSFQHKVTAFFKIKIFSPDNAGAGYSAEKLTREHNKIIKGVTKQLFANSQQFSKDKPIFTPSAPAALPSQLQLIADSQTSHETSLSKNLQQSSEQKALPLIIPKIVRRKATARAKFRQPNFEDSYNSDRKNTGKTGNHKNTLKINFKPEINLPTEKQTPEYTPVAMINRQGIEDARTAWSGLNLSPTPKKLPSLDHEVTAKFTTFKLPTEKKNFFKLEVKLRPKTKLQNLEKNIFFLIDISRSIDERELKSIRKAIITYLSTLPASDQWNLGVFSETTHFYSPDFLAASEFPKQQEKVFKFIRSRAGERFTNIFTALQQLMANLPRSEKTSNIFLITDGQITYGTYHIKSIVRDFARVARKQFSIFTFNAGHGGNDYLLQLLAYRSRGFYDKVLKIHDSQHRFLSFVNRFNNPVLAKVILNISNLNADETYPEVLPNLYRRNPIIIHGRAQAGDVITLRLAGYCPSGPREFFFQIKVPQKGSDNHELPREWARDKCFALMAQLSQQPKNKKLRQQIITLAEKYTLTETLKLFRKKSIFSPIKKLLDFKRW